MPGLNLFSFGGGTQSMAALVLAKRGQLAIDHFVFANVGEDSENPATLAYIRDVARPYAERHGLSLHERRYTRKDGTQPTLLQEMKRRERSNVIPARDANGRPGRRTCTADWKIRVINRFAREMGATRRNPATVNIGISSDEAERVNLTPDNLYTCKAYPLVDRGISRQLCASIILHEGLPLPPKSACYFCPFTSPHRWRVMRAEAPELFNAAVAVDRLAIERGISLRGRPLYLTRFGKPLDEAIPDPQILGISAVQTTMDDLFDGCESGYCFV